jgi:hypothetical protein
LHSISLSLKNCRLLFQVEEQLGELLHEDVALSRQASHDRIVMLHQHAMEETATAAVPPAPAAGNGPTPAVVAATQVSTVAQVPTAAATPAGASYLSFPFLCFFWRLFWHL